MASVTYRNAAKEDSALILEFIKELAVYEKLAHEVIATEADIARTLFEGTPRAFCMIAELDHKPVGFALCFYNYSTFQGKYGIYIEDLYVREDYRGHGIGKGFFYEIARRAKEEDCGRIQWWVLNWNTPSIEFYKSLGAEAMDEWTVFRLGPEQIQNMAQETKNAA